MVQYISKKKVDMSFFILTHMNAIAAERLCTSTRKGDNHIGESLENKQQISIKSGSFSVHWRWDKYTVLQTSTDNQ